MKRLSVKITSAAELLEAMKTGPLGEPGPVRGDVIAEAVDLFGTIDNESFWQHREHYRNSVVTDGRKKAFGLAGFIFLQGIFSSEDPMSEREKYHRIWKPLHIHHATKAGKVAFTENPDKGKRDIQLATTIGRLAKRLLPDLTDEQVKELSAAYALEFSEVEVVYGETEEDFIDGIKNGPTESCMATVLPKGHVHPAAAYASGDMMIATIRPGGERITARTIINKQTKEFSRIYGDIPRIKGRLEAAGFTQKVGALIGCRLLRIENTTDCGGWIVPYVDAGVGPGGGSLKFDPDTDGDYFLLTDGYGVDTHVGYGNRGVANTLCCVDDDDDEDDGDDSVRCSHCGEYFSADETQYVDSEDGHVCDSCLSDEFSFAVVALSASGRYVKEYIRNRDCTWVDCLNEYVHEDMLGELNLVLDEGSGEYINSEDAVICVRLGETYHRDDCIPVGTDDEGSALYLYDSCNVLAKCADSLYRRTDAATKDIENNSLLFWYGSEEIKNWTECGGSRDEWLYVRLDRWDDYVLSENYRPPVEEVVSPKHNAEPAVPPRPEPDTVIPMPDDLTWREQCVTLQRGGAKFEREEAPGIFVQESCFYVFNLPKEKYRRADGVRMPNDISWQIQCVQMQQAGYMFEYTDYQGGVSTHGAGTMALLFSEGKSRYKIISAPVVQEEPVETPVETWRERNLRLQAAGVRFQIYGCSGWREDTFYFDSSEGSYRQVQEDVPQ